MPIDTNAGSLETDDHGSTHGTWFVARRLDIAGRRAAAGWGICLDGGGNPCTLFAVFFIERAWPAASMTPPCLIYMSNKR